MTRLKVGSDVGGRGKCAGYPRPEMKKGVGGRGKCAGSPRPEMKKSGRRQEEYENNLF